MPASWVPSPAWATDRERMTTTPNRSDGGSQPGVANGPGAQPRRGPALARAGLLVTTLALALALGGTSWMNYRSAREAVDALNRGQSELLEHAAFEALIDLGAFARPGSRTIPPTPDPRAAEAALAALLDERSEAGLRYVALVDSAGAVVARVGDPVGEPGGDLTERGLNTIADGARLRTYLGRGPRAGRPYGVLEFEPVVANRLVARSARLLVLGSIGALVLLLAGIVFWRQSSRYEAAERRLEQQRRLSALGEMSAVLAHEIRNPLASLKGHAQLLTERLPPDSSERQRADRVVHEAMRLEALTSDLLAFVRSGPIDVRETDVAAVVRESAREVSGDVVVDAPSDPVRWPLDRGRFSQALVNLIQNAMQAANGSPAATTVVLEELPDRLRVSVFDRGPGIPAGEEDRIFDPFYTTRTTGTGLGLAVARRSVELHGGTLTAANRPGGGAEFRIDIPRRI